jgi:hydrogenase maturation protease
MPPPPGRGAALVLGVGSPLFGDDGLGVRAVELLAERRLPPDVQVEEIGTPGLGLAAWLEGWPRVIIVDAVRMGETPGAWRRFPPGQVRRMACGQALSLHEPGLADGLAMAQALDLLPEHTVIYGVEPERTDAGQGLSPAVIQALPGLIDSILTDLWKTIA